MRMTKGMKLPKINKLPSGSYHAVIMVNGERISITEDSEEKVMMKLLSLKSDYTPSNILLKDACLKYIEQKKGRLSPTTIDGYKRVVDNSFPRLMKMKVSEIDRKTLQRAVDDECKRLSFKGDKMTPKTINNRYSLVASVLKEYDKSFKIQLPEKQRKPIQILTPEEVYKVVKGTEIELPVLLAMWLSFTMSEIRGLTKSKSIHGGQISIVETVVRLNGEDVRKPGGKEQNRPRTLAIPEYIAKLIDGINGDIIVPQSPASITNRLYRLLDKNGLPHISFHQLRHINASVMAELDIPMKVANERGGWKSSYTREQVYTHVFSREREEADRKIDQYFGAIVSNK